MSSTLTNIINYDGVTIDKVGDLAVSGTTILNGKSKIQVDANTSGGAGSALTNAQLYIGGTTAPGYKLYLGYNTSSAYGLISSESGAGSFTPLLLNPYGGSVGINVLSSTHTLDVGGSLGITGAASFAGSTSIDASGNMTVGGTLTSTGNFTALGTTALFGNGGSGGGVSISSGYISPYSSNTNDSLVIRGKGTGALLLNYGGGSGGISVWDGGTTNVKFQADGAGNGTFAGSLTVAGNQINSGSSGAQKLTISDSVATNSTAVLLLNSATSGTPINSVISSGSGNQRYLAAQNGLEILTLSTHPITFATHNTIALTLDTSQNATFAGTVKANATINTGGAFSFTAGAAGYLGGSSSSVFNSLGTSYFASTGQLGFSVGQAGVTTDPTTVALLIDNSGTAIFKGGMSVKGFNYGIGSAFLAGQSELYTLSTNPLGIGTTGAAALHLYTGSNLAMYIDTSQNVGIGGAPTYKLDVIGNQSSPLVARVYNSATSGNLNYSSSLVQSDTVQVYVTSWGTGSARAGTGGIETATNHPLTFGTNDITRMILDTSGNLGVAVAFATGTTSVPGNWGIQNNVGTSNNSTQVGIGNAGTAAPSTSDYESFRSSPSTANNLTISTIEHFNIVDTFKGTSSTIGTQYGLYVSQLAAATTNYAIYTNGNTQSYFGGKVGIGQTTPTFQLEVLSTLTGTTAGSNSLISLSSNGSGRDASLRFNDNVNSSAKISYLSGALSFLTNSSVPALTIDLSQNSVFSGGTVTVNTGVYKAGTGSIIALSSGGGTTDIRLNYNYGGGSGGVGIYDGGTTNNAQFTTTSGNLLIVPSNSQTTIMGKTGLGVVPNTTSANLTVYNSTTYGTVLATDSTLGSTYGAIFRGAGITGQGGLGELGVLDNNIYTKHIEFSYAATPAGVNFYTALSAGSPTLTMSLLNSKNLTLFGSQVSVQPGTTGTVGAFAFTLDGTVGNFGGIDFDYNNRVTKGCRLFTESGYGLPVTVDAAGYFAISTAGTERVRVDSSGNTNIVSGALGHHENYDGSTTGSNNNYNVAGKTIVHFNGASSITLTGLLGSGIAGQKVLLFNHLTGAGATITLTYNDTNSSAGNRFITPGLTNFVISNGGCVEVVYILGSSVWAVVSK